MPRPGDGRGARTVARSEDVVREAASGRAALSTWSVVHRSDLPPFDTRVPYFAAVVDLAEGPRTTTGLVDRPDPARPRPGRALTAAFPDGVPLFGPAP
ncbi:OB-fold domain-containing protein [Streptomyces sp. NPDC059852]|uniref:OB-fold domain-containing protein n=1 Tax=Streptomyces sp. NPDC059852 TaxID=3346972 RepID=UPI003659D1A1